MNRFIFAVIVVSMLASACEKEACEKQKTGTQCFHNTTDVALDVYYDEEFAYSLAPGQERCNEFVTVGEHSYKIREEGIIVIDGFSQIKECREDQVVIY